MGAGKQSKCNFFSFHIKKEKKTGLAGQSGKPNNLWDSLKHRQKRLGYI